MGIYKPARMACRSIGDDNASLILSSSRVEFGVE